MPGYYMHLAASNPTARKNKSFTYGLEMPDLLKSYLKRYGIKETEDKYNKLKTREMPEFIMLKTRLQQKETKENNLGLHYGLSSNPDIKYYWNSLTKEQQTNPFYIGYLWHLLTDLITYKYIDIETKLSEIKDSSTLELEINELHKDWDKTNAKIKQQYKDVELPQEIEELKIVKFEEKSPTKYIEWETIKKIIDMLRKNNTLEENVEMVVKKLLK